MAGVTTALLDRPLGTKPADRWLFPVDFSFDFLT
jgi:hypothetical protein